MLEEYLHPLTQFISEQLYEMETFSFYRWANQKGQEESQKQRPNILLVSSGSSQPSSQGACEPGLWGVSVSLG